MVIMAVLPVLFRVLYLELSVQAWSVLHVSGSPREGDSYSLDQAFEMAKDLPDVLLELMFSTEAFHLTEQASVLQTLTIAGQWQTILLEASVIVHSGAVLVVVNATLLAQPTLLNSAFHIAGSIALLHVHLRDFPVTAIELTGHCSLNNVEVRGNMEVTLLILSGKADLILSNSSITGALASFVVLNYIEYPDLTSNITISESLFKENEASSGALLDLRSRALLHVEASEFSGNSGVVEMRGSGIQLKIETSTFRDNQGSLFVSVQLAQSSLHISNCTFSGNSHVSIQLFGFTGNFTFENSVLTQHKGQGPIWIENRQVDGEMCQAAILGSRFSDFNISVSHISPGSMLYFFNCVARLSRLSIYNAAVLSLINSLQQGLITSSNSQLWIDNLWLQDSGSAGYTIVVVVGYLSLIDFTIINPYSGEGIYVGLTQGTADVRRGLIAGGSVYHLGQSGLLVYKHSYFGFLVAQVVMEDVRIENSTRAMGLGIGVSICTFSIRNVRISNMTMGSSFVATDSTGQLFDAFIQYVVYDMHVIHTGNTLANFSNIIFSHNQVDKRYHYMGWSRSLIHAFNLTVIDVASSAIVRMQRSQFWVNDLKAERCLFKWLIGTWNSDFFIENFQAFDIITGGLIELTNSTLAIAHSSFHSISSDISLVDSTASHLSLLDVQWINLTTNSIAGKLLMGSSWFISHSLFQDLHATYEAGYQILESSLTVHSSTFRNVDFGLFQCRGSNVTITKARMEHVRNPMQVLRSMTAYGGVLGCLDCPLVILTAVHFFNVTAAVGGAVSVRRLNEQSTLVVQNCTFAECSASQAGALFIQNVSFSIEHSCFVLNTAVHAGGALYVAIKPWQQGFIRHTLFNRNSASEGGAIKWSNAEIQLLNTTFRENSAFYGADVASYGVNLSPRLTQVTGQEASGQPLTLIFELLDHYGRRVTASPYKVLELITTTLVSYRGNQQTLLNRGLFNYSELVIYASPGSHHTIQALLQDTQEDFTLNISGQIHLAFRNCTAGEVERTDRCEYCNPGNVSFVPSDSDCAYCPAHAFCAGGNQLTVDQHYWRSNHSSTTLLVCPLPDKCLGGHNSTCAVGFTGPLCNACAQGYTNVRTVECVKCADVAVPQLCGALFIAPLFIGMLLRVTVYRPNADKLYVLKSFLHYVQLLSALSFLRVSYSSLITWGLHSATYFASWSVLDFPLACLGVSHPIYAKAVLGSLFFPLFLLLSTLVCLLTTASWQRNSLLLVTSGLLYAPAVAVATSLPLLTCRTIDTAQEYLAFDLSEPCWTPVHLTYMRALVLPSLLLNIGLPIVIVLGFRCIRSKDYQRVFPFWACGYAWDLWDLVPLFFKGLLLYAVIANITTPPLLQVTYFLTILIVESVVTATLYSYVFRSVRLFIFSEASLLVVALTLGFCSYYLFYPVSHAGSRYFVDAMIVIINAVYIASCGYELLRERTEVREEMILVPHNTPEDSGLPSNLQEARPDFYG